MKSLFFIIGSFFSFYTVAVAASDTIQIPVYRQYFHDKISNEQNLIDQLDSQKDSFITAGANEEINLQLTHALFGKINELEEWIEENDKIEKNNDKVKLLTNIEGALRLFREGVAQNNISLLDLPHVATVLENIIHQYPASVVPFVENENAEVAQIIAFAFQDNVGFTEAKNKAYFKYSINHPDKILFSIKPYVNEYFADSLIYLACKYYPSDAFSNAQSINSPAGQLIQSSKYPLVKLIAELSKTENALMYFPFLDDLASGKKNIEDIKKFIENGESAYDSVGYYKLLVNTEIEYYKRLTAPVPDTPIALFGANGLRQTLKDKAIRHFINPINNLHEEENLSIRFRALDSLRAIDLYYMMVMGENDIYTSSYKHSFNRFIQKLGAKGKTDSLLMKVNFDYFKKFIKMAANFNKLDTFLKKMPMQSSESLMRAFVANLNQSDNLEDAMDVADSYSSISNLELQKRILNYVVENEKINIYDNNTRGILVYNLLKNIFLSGDTSKHIDLTNIAGIPSIYEMEKKTLQNDSGVVVEQVFFYGDKDGKTYFTPFLNSFSTKEWQITKKDEWVEIKSLKGKVWIFANLPLESDDNLDDSAQVHLNRYLESLSLSPSIVIHRGHSYWLPGTINRMSGNAKIVIIGSCGGYKNLNKILEISPDAHIISTKEIGAGDINAPILNYLNQALINGNNITWRAMWKNLTNSFSKQNKGLLESWENYIPPYRNLGTIFIKAYHKKMQAL
jgi:hypothetical protein